MCKCVWSVCVHLGISTCNGAHECIREQASAGQEGLLVILMGEQSSPHTTAES